MKDRTILAVKGLAIIGVVFHHLVNRREDPQVTEWIKVLPSLFHWCVLAFICVSGYLHALSDSRRLKSVTEFTFQRFNRLMIPWLLLIIVFALIWQGLQMLHLNIAVAIPRDFFGKIAVSLWPVTMASVGEQLYYLPILFGTSVAFVAIRSLLGLAGVWVLAVTTFIVSLRFYPDLFTGFSPGVFLWSLSFYAAGYLLFCHRTKAGHVRLTLVVCTIILVCFSGYSGIIRCLPLWMIAEGSFLRLYHIPGLESLGEASGTIYIYHTPFILQPMVIASTYLHGAVPQFIGLLLAAAIALGICNLFYHLLKNTRAKILLM
jgi:hypothetical protein